MGSKESLFNNLCLIPLLTSKPSKTIAHLKEEANAIDGDTAVKHSVLSTLNSFNLPPEDIYSLTEIIVGSKDSPISKLIGKLKNSDWVNDGQKYLDQIDGPQCPFCQADTITEQLAKHIRDYFDESYQHSINEIKAVQARYTSIVESIPKLDDYKKSQFSTGSLAQLNEHHAQLSKDAEANIELIKQKISNPSLQVTLSDISTSVSAFNFVVKSINKLIIAHNFKIDNSANELVNIKTDFWKILRYEYDQTISNFNNIQIEAEKK
ncbi:AAA family ATPase [Yersinia sp. 2544 StPb PI]|uniref:AAA family ATPase n=1 Tax=Yersinia sp. 2544 StPb PI TaxID=3117409 RepID=UPI003B2802DC